MGYPLSNRGPREHMVDEMRRAFGHPAATATRAIAAAFARERDQPIGTTVGTAKPGKPMREHAAANESLKLAFHEQGGATLVLTSVELPEEGLSQPIGLTMSAEFRGTRCYVTRRANLKGRL